MVDYDLVEYLVNWIWSADNSSSAGLREYLREEIKKNEVERLRNLKFVEIYGGDKDLRRAVVEKSRQRLRENREVIIWGSDFETQEGEDFPDFYSVNLEGVVKRFKP